MFACTDEHAAKMKLVIARAEALISSHTNTIDDELVEERLKDLEEALTNYHKKSELIPHGNENNI